MEEKRKPKPWWMWLVIGLALLLAYPLSFGPLQVLVLDGYLPAALYKLYAPVLWLARLDPIGPSTRWYWIYVGWWISDRI